MSDNMADLLKEVDPGEGRWWRVTFIENAATKPIQVSLMEDFTTERRGPSRSLGNRRTIAQPDLVQATAEALLKEVGSYADVVGEYPKRTPIPLAEGWVVMTAPSGSYVPEGTPRTVAHYFLADHTQSLCGNRFHKGFREQGIKRSSLDCQSCTAKLAEIEGRVA